ncbi:uncharacterized protein LOC115667093 [Syzygium oleosum]|uniref:uncharacterized protein LOC115667093 n=1 Tax=Syzygium oleosum TaxID=219896 RepID=UPI0024B9F584|nr:uncharacterized protein LOC115667093 [Syzygium oleosum]
MDGLFGFCELSMCSELLGRCFLGLISLVECFALYSSFAFMGKLCFLNGNGFELKWVDCLELEKLFCRKNYLRLWIGLFSNMVQTLEAIKGGGGSIRIGTTGTISALMTRELESIKSAPKTPISPRNRPRPQVVSISCRATTPKRPQQRKSMDGASSSNCADERSLEVPRKTKGHGRTNTELPMLAGDDVALDGTPERRKTDKKVTNIVEVVDIRCGNADRAWAGPITNRLKKLSFSKLSESIV